MLGRQIRTGLQFNDDFAENEQIGFVACGEFLILVEHLQFHFGKKRNLANGQFELDALLLEFLRHAIAKLVVNLERGTHELVTFFFEHDLLLGKGNLNTNPH